MNFFNIDLHISVIADMKKIFTEIGHSVTDFSLSNHTWVFNRRQDSVPMLDNGRWMHLSSKQYQEEFYNTYKNSLDKFDAFIVTYPPTFANLYKKFDKPIIVNIPIRYEWPFSFKKESWEDTNNFLRDGVKNGQVILVANNLYDKFYTEQFLDVEVTHIPSFCDYYGKYHTKKTDDFLYYSKNRLVELSNEKYILKSDFKSKEYSDIISNKGIIHFPYCPSYMSVFEHYSSNTPLLFPSQEFLYELFIKDYKVMEESSWYYMHNMPNKSIIEPYTGVDPNDYKNHDIIKKWISLSDFYDENWMPHIIYFNSFDELDKITEELDSIKISEKMKLYNIERKNRIYNLWGELVDKIK